MAESFDEGWELWKSDGTAAGTSLVSDLVPGRDSSYSTSLICYQNELYFTASGPALGVWRTDGTTAGTTQIFAGSASELYVWGSSLVFTGLQASTSGLYFSDGSVAGTTAVQSGCLDGENYEPLPGANVLMFSAHSNTAPGNELWRTDGTATGTYQVKDIRPGMWAATSASSRRSGTTSCSQRTTVRPAAKSSGAPTPNVTALVVGVGRGQPFTFAPVLPPECTAWIGLSQPSATVLAFGPQWSHQLTIPSSPAFTGVQFACQAVHLSTPLSLSRALQLTLGNSP